MANIVQSVELNGAFLLLLVTEDSPESTGLEWVNAEEIAAEVGPEDAEAIDRHGGVYVVTRFGDGKCFTSFHEMAPPARALLKFLPMTYSIKALPDQGGL